MKRNLPLLALFLILSGVCSGQAKSQNATTDDGRKVLLKADGTWKYVVEKPTSATTVNDCSKYIKTTTDRVTGRTRTMGNGNLILVGSDKVSGLGIITYLKPNDRAVYLIFTVEDPSGKCVESNATAYFLFRDGSRLEEGNASGFNCDRTVGIILDDYDGDDGHLKQLRSKLVQTIRVSTGNSIVEVNLPLAKANILMHQIDCLAKQ